MSLPTDADRPSTSDPDRPTSSRRPRTAAARRAAVRPDTGASGIGELPDQTFFPEGEEFDEEKEEDEEDEPDQDGVFAFARPVTAAPNGGYTTSEYGTTAPNTGLHPTSAGTSTSGATFGIGSPQTPGGCSDVSPSTGPMDIGGRLPELKYDPTQSPSMSGRSNPNNSSFAFTVQGERANEKKQHRPPTGRSLLDRLQRRKLNTASTAMTGTTDYTTTIDTSEWNSEGSRDDTDGASIKSETSGSEPRHTARRMRSSAPLIPDSDASEITSEAGTRRGISRGSYGLTELTGDITVADGKTTWGDGLGGMMKQGSEEGSLVGMDLDVSEEDSPYPEVRASVSNLDDPEMPALTIRAWCLGIIFSIICTAINTFFSFRNPAPYISPLIVQVTVYPFGKLLAYSLPIRIWILPRWLSSIKFSLNPGPFNIKEHTVIIMMANISVAPAYALYMTVSTELYYGQNYGAGFALMFILATQITGFSIAGLCRRIIIWPASLIWPGVLVVATSLNTFHAEDEGYHGGMTRFKFLMLAGGSAFAWYFLPGLLFTALSWFSWICWMAPNNVVINELFGVANGLGMGVMSFDWTQIAWIGSPLVIPWWAELNIGIGFVLFYWIVVPILYYTNVWETSYLPMNVIQAGDRFGVEFDVFNIITPDLQLNETAYSLYSPVYLSASYSMTIMLAFALSTALIVHTALHHGSRLYRAMLNIKTEADDIHMKLIRQYPEVPDWWFAAILAVCFILAVVSIEIYHTGLPVWGYILAILLPFIYTIPSAFVFAMTSQLISINIMGELIPGYIFQGKPIPGMIFKVFGVQTLTSSLTFLQDQKLGHYMKVPPRVTFIAQLSACAITSIVMLGTKEVLFSVVEDVGLIGPKRLFSKGAMYYPQVYAALAGAIIPIPLWFWVRKYPRSIFRNLNLPVLFNGGLFMPPATGVNYSSWFVTGFIFQFWIRRRRFAWWSKYNYVLSAALDVGTALSVLFIFLVFGLSGVRIKWWGNTVYQNTADWQGNSALRLAPEEGFGPSTWKV